MKKVGDNIKIIQGKYFELIQVPKFYQDSQDKFIEEWNKIHSERPYTDYLKKEAEKNHRKFDYMNAMVREPYPIYSTYL